MQSIDNAKERAAAQQRATAAREQEFMSLAPGVGIIPPEFRNKGYDKLDYGPGEGGIAGLLESRAGGGETLSKSDFLAGIRELVGALGGNDTTEKIDGRRRRQGVQ